MKEIEQNKQIVATVSRQLQEEYDEILLQAVAVIENARTNVARQLVTIASATKYHCCRNQIF